jgi:hypothetical protein
MQKTVVELEGVDSEDVSLLGLLGVQTDVTTLERANHAIIPDLVLTHHDRNLLPVCLYLSRPL